jgi:hypothetical protein
MREEDPYRVYTLQEVADRLRSPYSVVRDAVFAGRWPHVKISPRKRVMTQANLEATLALLHQAPTPESSKHSAREARARVAGLLEAA